MTGIPHMTMKHIFYGIGLLAFLSLLGCTTTIQQTAPLPASSLVSTYESRLDASLFESDRDIISQEAVDRILDGQVDIEDKSKIAIYKVPNTRSGVTKYYGYGYWLSEEYLDLERQYFDTILGALAGHPKVGDVKPLPSLLTPKELTLSRLRESAVRLQAKLLIVYSVQSYIFEDVKIFAKDEVKAYSTCEMILFHTRTGIIPFSEVVTKKVVEKQTKEDANLLETRKRAENRAILDSLRQLSSQLNEFLSSDDSR